MQSYVFNVPIKLTDYNPKPAMEMYIGEKLSIRC